MAGVKLVSKVFGISREKLERHMQSGYLPKPSSSGLGPGKRRIYSLEDCYRIGLFLKLIYGARLNRKTAGEFTRFVDWRRVKERGFRYAVMIGASLPFAKEPKGRLERIWSYGLRKEFPSERDVPLRPAGNAGSSNFHDMTLVVNLAKVMAEVDEAMKRHGE